MLKPILIVEDDLRDLELTLIALERTGLANQVIILRDGVEALDYLFRRNEFSSRPEGNPAVVMLDLKLPRVDGLGVLEAVRANEKLQHIPIVMLTSSQMETDLLRAYELGVNAYVVKPFEFDEFMKAVSKLGLFWAVVNEPPLGSVRPVLKRD
jgi:CheY-like chemotaxis protein